MTVKATLCDWPMVKTRPFCLVIKLRNRKKTRGPTNRRAQGQGEGREKIGNWKLLGVEGRESNCQLCGESLLCLIGAVDRFAARADRRLWRRNRSIIWMNAHATVRLSFSNFIQFNCLFSVDCSVLIFHDTSVRQSQHTKKVVQAIKIESSRVTVTQKEEKKKQNLRRRRGKRVVVTSRRLSSSRTRPNELHTQKKRKSTRMVLRFSSEWWSFLLVLSCLYVLSYKMCS